MKNISDSYFSIIVDESRDVFTKEQLAIVMRYVGKFGQVIERFIDITHIASAHTITLKITVENILLKHSLSIQRIHDHIMMGHLIYEENLKL
ncbi:hypothetical protein MA16_Dca010834 [Dendrobium catenatum]|uniref:DUF4371 domain-containing protein n=1 Tax=Dendrobium catenatum TaxID=906689 RepID=A0A2I0W5B6_9ASPA|nr:hypothetical protein MA16_Dca010834 [Dendrobium catenatum]